MKPTEDLIRLAQAGANLDLSSIDKKTDDYIEIVRAARQSGARVTINGSKGTHDLIRIAHESDLIRIAHESGGCVTFHFGS